MEYTVYKVLVEKSSVGGASKLYSPQIKQWKVRYRIDGHVWSQFLGGKILAFQDIQDAQSYVMNLVYSGNADNRYWIFRCVTQDRPISGMPLLNLTQFDLGWGNDEVAKDQIMHEIIGRFWLDFQNIPHNQSSYHNIPILWNDKKSLACSNLVLTKPMCVTFHEYLRTVTERDLMRIENATIINSKGSKQSLRVSQ